MEDKEINEYIIKIQGKATLFEPLNLSRVYKVEIDGAITDVIDTDNENGTYSRTYRFKPTLVNVLADNGEVTRTKDIRSRSQQLRAVITREWRDLNEPISAEDYYEKEMKTLIAKRINKEI